MNETPRIGIVDDDPSTCRALQRLLRVAGYRVETYLSASEYLSAGPGQGLDCLLLDVHMPGTDGFALQAELGAQHTSPPIVFLTGRGDVPMSVRAMRAGASDFLLKPVDETELLDVIARSISEYPRRERSEEKELRDRLANLTSREREVLGELLTGALNKQIAKKLDIAERTVKMHRSRVMRKLNARTLLDLAPYRQVFSV